MLRKDKYKENDNMNIFELMFHAIIMFLVIFNPPLLSFNTIHIVALTSLIYLFFNNYQLNKAVKINRILIVYIILLLLAIYQGSIAVLSGHSYMIVSNYIFWIFEIIPYSVALIVYISKHNNNFDALINIICFACLIQSIMAVMALTIPSVKNYFINRIVAYGYSRIQGEKLALFRNYGLADALTFTSSIVQSMIACIALYYYLMKKKYLYLAVFFLGTFSAAINTRSSILVMAIGISVIMLTLRGVKMLLRFLLVLAFMGIMVILGLSFLRKYNEWTYDWMIDGVKEMFAFAAHDTSNYGGYFKYVSKSSTFPLPSGIHFVFGYGIEIMHGTYYNVKSDVGYINDMWRTGLIGTAIIYISYIFAVLRFTKSRIIDSNTGKFLCLFFLISAAAINVKGYFFVYNNVTTLFWILFIFCCCQKNKKDYMKEVLYG